MRKTWSRRFRTLNFMQETSSFFCAHSIFVWSTIWSMLLPFQRSFFAGWAAANANSEHNTNSFMVSLMCSRDTLKKVLRTIAGNDDCTTTDANGLGTRLFIRSPRRRIVGRSSRSGVPGTHDAPTSTRPRIFFSFSMVFDYRGLDAIVTGIWDCAGSAKPKESSVASCVEDYVTIATSVVLFPLSALTGSYS